MDAVARPVVCREGGVLVLAQQGALSWDTWQRNITAQPIPYVLALLGALPGHCIRTSVGDTGRPPGSGRNRCLCWEPGSFCFCFARLLANNHPGHRRRA